MNKLEIGEKRNYGVGDIVFCVISSNANLTLFKEYSVEGYKITKYDRFAKIVLTDDYGDTREYNANRFLPVEYKYLREKNLDDLLK